MRSVYPPTKVQIDEEITDSGQTLPLRLVAQGQHFALFCGDTHLGAVSSTALLTVLKRYARPLDTAFEAQEERLTIDDRYTLLAWRYRAPVDLEDKLYLILLEESCEAIAVLSRQVANALRFLCTKNNPQPSTSDS